MRIVYLGNFSQKHCTEVHLAATLESLGHAVIRVQERPGNGLSELWYTVHGTQDIDLYLWTRTLDLSAPTETMHELLRLCKKNDVPTASYHLDLYVGLKRADGLDSDPFWRTDYVFTPDGDPASQAVFEAKGINHVYMKPGVYKPECYMAERNGEQLPVVFVGGGSATGEGPQYGHKEWSYRGDLIKFLKDTYGGRFHKFGWPQETIRNKALNQLYANADIVVGDSLCLNFDHPYYWSDRVYETMGRGGFIIHPYIKGMEEEFTDKQNIVFYEYGNFMQLQSLIDYYTMYPEEREAIRRAGHEFVKNHATYTERLTQMLDVIFGGGHAPAAYFDDLKTVEGSGRGDTPIPSPRQEPLNISLGAGMEPEQGDEWVNLDIVDLPEIDVVHNLMQFPWPFDDNSADYIKAKDLIEHMANYTPDNRPAVIAFMEECYRIMKPGATLWIQTPSWDADFLWIDPTHVRGFDIRSFDFFDPDTDFGRSTGFYSKVKFHIRRAERLENGNLQFELDKL